MSKKILVVDDEEDLSELVRYNLASEGFDVVCAGTGEEAIRLSGSKSFDLVVLDIMLPGISGTEVAGKLKKDLKTRNIPIIMLTARSDESDIVNGLQIADDYITKPFSPRILCARVNALFRRKDGEDEKDSITKGDITIYPGHRKVDVAGKPVELSFTEFQILMVLSKRPGWVFTRSHIVDEIRGDNYPVTERSVDVQIAGLRKKLGPCGYYIETVRSVGYKFKENP